MRFPVKVKYRGAVVKIYGKTPAYAFYRVAGHIGGKRKVVSFRQYGQAKDYADRLVRDIYHGRQAAALSESELAEVMAAKSALGRLREHTSKHFSLAGAVSQFADAVSLLPDGVSLVEAVRQYASTLAIIKPVSVKDAVAEYLQERAALTVSRNGERPQISPKFAYVEAKQLEQVAVCYGNTPVSSLTPELVQPFFAKLADMTPKTRNHYRNTLRAFLDWARRRNYISETSVKRTQDADCMRQERAAVADIKFYTPAEFAKLLAASEGIVQVMIAIGGLAGLRVAELLRLDWSDVWRVSGFIEVGREKAKTRQRRLAPICESLAAWLEPWRGHKSGLLWTESEMAFQRRLGETHQRARVPRKANGLRHSFVTYSYAMHGEVQTAQWAGHSPAQLFAHYRGLATPEEARAWFAVRPPTQKTVQ